MLNLEDVLKGNGFEGLGGAAKIAAERHAERATERLTESLVSVMGTADALEREAVANVRAIRKQEKVAVNQLKKVGAAVAYLKQTGNPLPLYLATGNSYAAEQFCQELDVPVPPADDPLWQVQE